MIKICAQCGEEYKTYKSKSKFCSQKCSAENQSKKVLKICEHCGEEYLTHKYMEDTSKFCSHECRKAAQYLPGFDGENKICTECNILKPLSEFGNVRTKCKACETIKMHEYYEKNKEKIQKYAKEHRDTEKEKERNRKYREKNRESVRALHRAWKWKNIEHVRLKRIFDQGKKRSAFATLTVEEWFDTLDYFNHECVYCSDKEGKLQQEHFICVKNGGGYEKKNILPSCKKCNQSKGNKDFYDWYDHQPFFSMKRAMKIEIFIIEHNTEGNPSGNGSEPVESRGRLRL